MKLKTCFVWICLALVSVSCFEVDEAVPPYELPENVDTLMAIGQWLEVNGLPYQN